MIYLSPLPVKVVGIFQKEPQIIINMKKLLFTSFRSWQVCMLAGAKEIAWGTSRIITGLFIGAISALWWMVRLIEKFCIREKVAAGIIAVAILMLSFGWIATYMQSKTLLTTTEHQRDSIAYTLNKFIQAYDTVIIDGDTIKHNR